MSSLTLSRSSEDKKPAAGRNSYLGNSDCDKMEAESVLQFPAVANDGGVIDGNGVIPFLEASQKLVECRACQNVIYSDQEVVSCSIHECQVSYHLTCAKDHLGLLTSSKEFKCPQHECYLCKKKSYLWQCSRCDLASHDKCAAYPEYVLHSHEKPRQIICWRHTDFPPLKPAVPTTSIEEVFRSLPLPCVVEEFNIDLVWKDTMANNLEPPSYVHVKRNIYHTKKKSYDGEDMNGCTNCVSDKCDQDCVCRSQCISCSSACGCSEMCTNRPFLRGKRVEIVMTQRCGWGLEAAEFIKKGDFIIEYIGEVISDTLRETRLWDMKNQGVTNFYMCEVGKDFTIDASFKGNESRFMNHSCDPNCNLEKWEVSGETRLGVFAARSIIPGEQLTYHYRYVQYGPEVECHCGNSNCQGYLGIKKKIPRPVLVDWGEKRQRLFIRDH